MTTEGGGTPPVNWAALAPLVEHETREAIIEALCWIGPLSSRDLKGVLDDPELHLASVAYHVRTLAGAGALTAVHRRPAGPSVEKLYYFAPPA